MMSDTLIKPDVSKLELLEAERDYEIKKRTETEQRITGYTRRMVEAELGKKRADKIIAEHCRFQIRKMIPNYDEYKAEGVRLHY